MADPKYANLPGILYDGSPGITSMIKAGVINKYSQDLNSPDVYETSDLPESEQNIQTEQEEPQNESIERPQIDMAAAFDRFRGKGGKGAGAGRRTEYEGYEDYEMVGEDGVKIESPQQKYMRLQHEIRELGEEVNRIKENVKEEASAEKLSPVMIGKQLEYLQHQLTDLHLEKLLGPDASVDLSDPQGALQKRLMTQLESFKPSQKKPSTPQSKDATPSDSVRYELFYRPEQAQFSKNAKVASLEERLDRLEAALGNTSQDKLGLLTTDTDNKSVIGAVSVINSKLSLLEPSNLEHVEVRLHSVIQKLDKIAEKKSTQEDGEKQNKISELYGIVKKWESVADVLPQVVDRLSALKDLHEQALQFSQALTYLDTTQQEINSSLKSHGDMLKQLEGQMKDNVSIIKNNCDSLDSRIQAIQK